MGPCFRGQERCSHLHAVSCGFFCSPQPRCRRVIRGARRPSSRRGPRTPRRSPGDSASCGSTTTHLHPLPLRLRLLLLKRFEGFHLPEGGKKGCRRQQTRRHQRATRTDTCWTARGRWRSICGLISRRWSCGRVGAGRATEESVVAARQAGAVDGIGALLAVGAAATRLRYCFPCCVPRPGRCSSKRT